MKSRLEKNKKEIKKIEKIKERKVLKFILKLLIRFILLIGIIFILLRYIGTSGIIVREYGKSYDTLPSSFNGFKIVQISDINYGSSIKSNELKKIVNKINKIKPDLVVFTGGLVYKDYNLLEKDKDNLIELLSNINPTTGKYYVTGDNDDYECIQILNKSSFIYLDNKLEHIYFNDNKYIVLNGIVDKQDFIVELDHFNITLIHKPDEINFNNKTSEIIMAGNSLNGQIRIPFVGGILKFNGSKKYYESYYRVNKSDLYISSGLGTKTYPLRAFNHPSINFYRLKSSN